MSWFTAKRKPVGVEPGDWGYVEIVSGPYRGIKGEYGEDWRDGQAMVFNDEGAYPAPHKYLVMLADTPEQYIRLLETELLQYRRTVLN